jgi:uncharacterized protein
MPTTSPVQSPCIRNCCLNQQDMCVGCFRSIDEIMMWSQASEMSKQKMLENAAQRHANYIAGKPGSNSTRPTKK